MIGPCPDRKTWEGFISENANGAGEKLLAEHLRGCSSCQKLLDALSDDDSMRRAYGTFRHATAAIADKDWSWLPHGYGPNSPGGDVPPVSETVLPETLGRFRLIHKLGSGGFGVVCLAEDTLLKRHVALKLPRHSLFAAPEQKEWFLREARAAAALHHPNIVPLYDAGEADGICYLATEYCPGITLDEWRKSRSEPVPLRTAAEIVAVLAGAMHQAHQTQILHRDLKPKNILLEDRELSPDLPFCPRITDFGLARFMDAESSLVTSMGLAMGTPAYMAPEQILNDRDRVGFGCDIYSLGVILYELLTSTYPHGDKSQAEYMHATIHDPPVSPRKRNPKIPLDLEAICLHCLERKPENRYDSAEQLQQDLQRYLNGESTLARPLSLFTKAKRSAIRQPAVAGLLLSLIVIVAVIVGGLTAHSMRLAVVNDDLSWTTGELYEALDEASAAQKLAEENARRSRGLQYAAQIGFAGQAWNNGDYRQLRALIDQLKAEPELLESAGIEWNFLRRVATPPPHKVVFEGKGAIYWINYSPDGQEYAVVGEDGILRLFDAATDELVKEIDCQQGEVNQVTYSPDGHTMATAGDDGTVCLWAANDGTELRRFTASSTKVFNALFTPDGERLLTCGEEPTVAVWDAASGEQVAKLKGLGDQMESLAIAPDGKTAFAVGRLGRISILDLDQLRTTPHHQFPLVHRLHSISMSRDGRYLVTGSDYGYLNVLETNPRREIDAFRLLDDVRSVRFFPNGHHFVTTDDGGMVRVWNLAAANDSAPVRLHVSRTWHAANSRIYATAVDPNRLVVLTGGTGGTVDKWDLTGPPAIRRVGFHGGEVREVRPIAESELLIASARGVYRVDANSGRKRSTLIEKGGPWIGGVVSKNGRRVAASSEAGEVIVWNAAGEEIRRRTFTGSDIVDVQAISPDGEVLAIAFGEHQHSWDLQLVATETLKSLRTHTHFSPGNEATFSPGGTTLYYGAGESLKRVDVQSGDEQIRDNAHQKPILALAFNGSTRQYLTGGKDRIVYLWEVGREGPTHRLAAHRSEVRSGCFSRDGQTILTADEVGYLKLWQAKTGQELVEIPTGVPNLGGVLITNDGRHLVVWRDRGGEDYWICDVAPLDEDPSASANGANSNRSDR